MRTKSETSSKTYVRHKIKLSKNFQSLKSPSRTRKISWLRSCKKIKIRWKKRNDYYDKISKKGSMRTKLSLMKSVSTFSNHFLNCNLSRRHSLTKHSANSCSLTMTMRTYKLSMRKRLTSSEIYKSHPKFQSKICRVSMPSKLPTSKSRSILSQCRETPKIRPL